jgi:hypothetical protein
MSRPTAAQRAQNDAQHTKAVSTYAEVALLTDAVNHAITRESNRFSEDSEVAKLLYAAFASLIDARTYAQVRAQP